MWISSYLMRWFRSRYRPLPDFTGILIGALLRKHSTGLTARIDNFIARRSSITCMGRLPRHVLSVALIQVFCKRPKDAVFRISGYRKEDVRIAQRRQEGCRCHRVADCTSEDTNWGRKSGNSWMTKRSRASIRQRRGGGKAYPSSGGRRDTPSVDGGVATKKIRTVSPSSETLPFVPSRVCPF